MEKHYPILELKPESTFTEVNADIDSRLNNSARVNKKVISCLIDIITITTELGDRLDRIEKKIRRQSAC